MLAEKSEKILLEIKSNLIGNRWQGVDFIQTCVVPCFFTSKSYWKVLSIRLFIGHGGWQEILYFLGFKAKSSKISHVS